MISKIFTIPIIELLAKIITFITIIIMTRILPLDEMGKYSLIVTLAMISSVFMDGGINNKIYASILQGAKSKLSEYYAQKIIFSFTVIFIVIIYSFIKYDYWLEISFYLLITFFLSQINLYKFVYRANQIKIMDSVCILIDPIFKILILLPLYLFNNIITLKIILLIFLISSIIEYILIEKIFFRYCKFFRFKTPPWKEFLGTLSEVKFFIIFYFIYILFQRVDVFFIENYLDIQRVAIYFSAYNIYTAIVIFMTAIVTSSFPKIKNFKLYDKVIYFKKYYVVYILSLSASYIVIPLMYPIIYPVEYLNGSKVLFLLLFSIPFVFISYLTIYSLNFLKLESKSVLPVSIVLLSKILVFLFFRKYFNNIITFSKAYIVFEMLLSLVFLIVYYFNLKGENNEEII